MDRINCIIDTFNKYKMPLDKAKAEQFIKYYNLLVETNKVMNLTAITEWDDVVIKHFVDSCMSIQHIPNGSYLLDVGAGAGFPSIPLKIVRPDLNIVMLDSLAKRVNFLNEAIIELRLNNIKAVHSRAEDYVNVSRETFDIVVARAVANMSTLTEYCLPYVKLGGKMIAYKANVDEELASSEKAIDILGGRLERLIKYDIEGDNRSLVIIDKVKNTPQKYPRGKNKPRTNPIV